MATEQTPNANPMIDGIVKSSFRDPSGFLFRHQGVLYRQVNRVYKENFDHLVGSGLYEALIENGLLIPHEEVDIPIARNEQAYKIIKPELIPFISYPYEWSFSQLKDAALTTLALQMIALDYGMSLKDCSAYNIQFKAGRCVLIDTLSFEKYREGEPWVAYKQFCQHFLAPLALMSYKDVRLSQLLRIYIDGIPLDLASSLLPRATRFKFSLLVHLHFHARSQKRYAGRRIKKDGRKMNRLSFRGLMDSLETAVKSLQWKPRGTEWADYYGDTNYSESAWEDKKRLVAEFLKRLNPQTLWDLGANVGIFSRIAGHRGVEVISFDVDPAAVEKNYLQSKRAGENSILPLLVDLTNPSPGLGWENRERNSLIERGPADTVLALALIHHLAISNNLPFRQIVSFFKKICRSLIIEFIPKSDSQVQRLLATRDDIFPDYVQKVFEREFNGNFHIRDSAKIRSSERTVYLMERKKNQTA